MKDILRLKQNNQRVNFRKNTKPFFTCGTSKSVTLVAINPVLVILTFLLKYWLSNILLNQQLLPIYLKGQKSSRVHSL